MAIMWRKFFNCRILKYSLNFINAEVNDSKNGLWRLTGFYGYPEIIRRRESWKLISSLSKMSQLPWCIIGDFNDMFSDEDKCGRVDHPAWLLSGFIDVISGCGLTDLVLEGYPYTWAKNKGKEMRWKKDWIELW